MFPQDPWSQDRVPPSAVGGGRCSLVGKLACEQERPRAPRGFPPSTCGQVSRTECGGLVLGPVIRIQPLFTCGVNFNGEVMV